MPSPRTSIRPARASTGRTSSRPCLASTWARSSATSRANGIRPCAAACSSASASLDLPEPEGPRISTARAPTSTAEAWIEGDWFMPRRILGSLGGAAPSQCRQPHREACAQYGRFAAPRSRRHGGAVLGPQPAAVGLDDLLGNRKAETRVLAETVLRPVGVEPLENIVEGLGPDARTVVVHHDLDRIAELAAGHAHGRIGLRERARVVDQVVDHLAEPRIVARDDEGEWSATLKRDGDLRAIGLTGLVLHRDHRVEEL